MEMCFDILVYLFVLMYGDMQFYVNVGNVWYLYANQS